tara:strand:+ start:508 stop:1074 length:567 start_codon:yes stop_codon:yes gene_type:complete
MIELTLPAFLTLLSVASSVMGEQKVDYKEIYCLAANSYFEARGEPFDGKIAVAQVAINRVKSNKYPDSICKVITEGPIKESWKTRKEPTLPVEERVYYPRKDRCQFSWYCDGMSDKIPLKRKNGKWNKTIERMWRDCVYAALLVYTNKTKDLVGKSTHYYAYDKVNPKWASTMKEYTKIGGHRFMYYD